MTTPDDAPIEIPVQELHQCKGFCITMVPDPDVRDTGSGIQVYKFVEAKCDRNGTAEDSYIHIASFELNDPNRPPMVNPDEIVIPDSNIRIEFNYPLENPVSFPCFYAGGFTRQNLIWTIVYCYKLIYEEEERSIKDQPVLPIGERGMIINRNQTDGIYGIWGHCINDLVIESIEYHPNTKTVSLGIGS